MQFKIFKFWQKYLNFGTFNFKAKNTILSMILLRQMTKKSPDGFGFFFFGFSMKVWRSQFFQPVICLPLNSKTKSGFSLLNRGREIWAIFFCSKRFFFPGWPRGALSTSVQQLKVVSLELHYWDCIKAAELRAGNKIHYFYLSWAKKSSNGTLKHMFLNYSWQAQ